MEKQQFITYAESFLEHSASMEMLCAADKKMENPILYLNEAARDFLQHGGVPTIHIPRGSDASVLLGQSIHFFHTNPERERNVFVALADGTIVQYDNMLKLGAWLLNTRYTAIHDDGHVVAFHASWRDYSYTQVTNMARAILSERNRVTETRKMAWLEVFRQDRLSCQVLIEDFPQVYMAQVTNVSGAHRELELSINNLPRDESLRDREVFVLASTQRFLVAFRGFIHAFTGGTLLLSLPKAIYERPLRHSLRVPLAKTDDTAIILLRAELPESEGSSLIDISSDGLGVVTPIVPGHPYLIGERICVRFKLREFPSFNLKADVRHVDDSADKALADKEVLGIRFHDLSSKENETLAAYIHLRELEIGQAKSGSKTGTSPDAHAGDVSFFQKFKNWLDT
ncbi:hypothetical protein HAP94_11155 [Acidithiobacillus ferrivorans]|nr:hypothetical protein [Acidithiobacillus ferrivorans]